MAIYVPDRDALDATEAQLAWLDRVLDGAVARQRSEGRWRGEDDLRGVYVSPELATAVIAARTVGASVPEAMPADRPGPLTRIAHCFGLDAFERFALLLALAPELDGRYRTVLGYLNDDVALGAPTVALAVELYAGAGPHSAPLRRAFRATSPLVRYRLLRLRAASGSSSLLRHGLEVDDWVVARMLGEEIPGPFPGERWQRIEPQDGVGGGRRSLPLVVVCGDRRAAIEDAAGRLARPLIVVDLEDADDPEERLRIGARHARLDGLGLAIHAPDTPPALTALTTALANDGLPVAVILEDAGTDALPDDWERVRLPAVSSAQRRARWAGALAAAGIAAPADALEAVAASHPIGLERVDAAVARLASADTRGTLTAGELRAAARAVARHQLGSLARMVPDVRAWEDLVLPAATVRQLREIAAAIEHRQRVLHDWGFGTRAGGRGMHLLFSGASGTGKTLAASVIAGEAGYALYAVDLARVVDKYLGETEKQLDRVFAEASAAGAVLLFDEADALFGQRAEVHDARDRYANVEVAYLLQRLEAHDGVTILATNLPHHLDQAFARRLHHRVEFPMPDRALRERLWRAVMPEQAPLDRDLELGLVAERFELSGGSIRNAAMTAAYLAAHEDRPIALRDTAHAVARELEKTGRPATRAEFGDLYPLLSAAGEP
jgi:DNA polymerase III delta prime subunit